jgi:alanine racemase
LISGRPTWAQVDLTSLAHNFRLMKDAVGPAVSIMPAMKADAYGHGAVECARTLEREGADWFGVALPEEGISLRKSGIKAGIFCLAGFFEGQESLIIAESLTPAVCRFDLLERLDQAAREAGCVADYHLKIDTGMRRLGVVLPELAEFLERAAQLKNVRLDGVMSHMASADLPEKEEFTCEQIELFASAVRLVRSRGYQPTWIHQANSAAAHAHPESRGNMVRLGGVLYGLWADVTNREVTPLDWKPVLSLYTQIEFLKAVPTGSPIGYGNTFVTQRDSRIATLPIGYGDGLPRALSNLGRVIVRGRHAPIVGRVSMDLTLIDVTDLAEAELGDEVVIIGSQDDCSITAEQLAEAAETISYEVTCRISDRVPRRYV